MGRNATVTAVGDGGVSAPAASFGKEGVVSAASSLSIGHLNLSHPTGSAAKAGVATIKSSAMSRDGR